MKRMIPFLMLLAGWSCLTGCASSERQGNPTIKEYLDALERGKARGHLSTSVNGNVLSAGMLTDTRFYLGPSGVLTFDGDVDFTRPTMQPGDVP